VHSTTTCDLSRPSVPQLPPSHPETMAADADSRCLPARGATRPAGHDPALVVTALEQLASQRAAMEWLLESGLLPALLA